ncbi:DnaJ domain-containing protein [Devosia submarina]|uniref:DnaJ domain-containing protein n=1 Tax=Devosia submarina TaxID=1173082 RepID=UPI000D346CC4|nr:DnaJ domain-containing protein [Devosia submarina]
MSYILLGGVTLLAILAAYQYIRRLDPRTIRSGLRWLVGGAGALLTIGLVLARRIDLAVFVGAGVFSILRTGRLGPFSLDGNLGDPGNISKVRSRFFAMELDHDTGAVAGRVTSGQFTGADLMDLGEYDTRLLIEEVQGDADSISLLQSWLDSNRAGWREYFAEQDSAGNAGPSQSAPVDELAEAYEILGLQPGASDDDIKAAHRELMKAVHPDHGGSSYLASKINEARDRLLRH